MFDRTRGRKIWFDSCFQGIFSLSCQGRHIKAYNNKQGRGTSDHGKLGNRVFRTLSTIDPYPSGLLLPARSFLWGSYSPMIVLPRNKHKT